MAEVKFDLVGRIVTKMRLGRIRVMFLRRCCEIVGLQLCF